MARKIDPEVHAPAISAADDFFNRYIAPEFAALEEQLRKDAAEMIERHQQSQERDNGTHRGL